MSTVLTLEPAFFPCMNLGWLKGSVTAGNTVIAVPYLNWPDPWGIDANSGMKAFDSLLLSHINDAGGVIAFGHSMGSQVLCKWLREKGPTSSADPAKVRFIMTGNPERRYGGVVGMCNHNTAALQSPGWTGGVHNPPGGSVPVNVRPADQPGVPAGNRYAVTDFARQYDHYADYPSIVNPSAVASQNASSAIHMDYFHVALTDAANVSYGPENNVTYVWSPTRPLPKVSSSWWLNAAQKAALEASSRPAVESQYARPVTIP